MGEMVGRRAEERGDRKWYGSKDGREEGREGREGSEAKWSKEGVENFTGVCSISTQMFFSSSR